MERLTLLIFTVLFLITLSNIINAATDLKLNPRLNYNSDSDDGPLITGKNLSDAKTNRARPYHIIFYHRECYNSKRQARRTVELYKKFKDSIEFIVIDLDELVNRDQLELKKRYYKNYIPHVTILDNKGKVVYDKAGEIKTDVLSEILKKTIS